MWCWSRQPKSAQPWSHCNLYYERIPSTINLIRPVYNVEKNGLETMTHKPQGIKLSVENCRKEKATSEGETAQGLAKARLTNERPPALARSRRSDGERKAAQGSVRSWRRKRRWWHVPNACHLIKVTSMEWFESYLAFFSSKALSFSPSDNNGKQLIEAK